MIRWALFGVAIAIFSVMFGFTSIVATLAGMGKILVYVPILGGIRYETKQCTPPILDSENPE